MRVGRVITSVTVFVRALKEKRLELSTPKIGRHTACIDPEVKSSKVKVTRLSNALAVIVGMQVDMTA